MRRDGRVEGGDVLVRVGVVMAALEGPAIAVCSRGVRRVRRVRRALVHLAMRDEVLGPHHARVDVSLVLALSAMERGQPGQLGRCHPPDDVA